MKFRLKSTQIAFILGCCCALPCYGAATSMAASAIEDDSFETVAKPAIAAPRTITLEQAVKDSALRSDFFAQGPLEMPALRRLIDIATSDDAAAKTNARLFLEQCVLHGGIKNEFLNTLIGEKSPAKKAFASYLLGFGRGSSDISNREDVHAFALPITFVPAQVDLPAYLVATPVPCTLPLAEQMYLLNVQTSLANGNLPEALEKFDVLLEYVQQIAIADRSAENLTRAATLVDLLSKIREIAPVISNYLRSMNSQLAAIVPEVATTVPSRLLGSLWTSSTMEYSLEQQSKRLQLVARNNLAYGIFDALFGGVVRPASVPAPISFTTDPSPANQLAALVHKLYPLVPVANIGTIVVVNRAGAVGDENAEALGVLCAQTRYFLSKVIGATDMQHADAFRAFDTLDLANNFLRPAAPLVASVEVSAAVIPADTAVFADAV